MGNSSHFSGQPLYCQVIKLLDKSKVLHVSREKGSERYVKRFNGWVHLLVMPYAVIMRFPKLPALLLNHLFLTKGLGYVKQQTRPLIISSRALKFCYTNFLSDSNK